LQGDLATLLPATRTPDLDLPTVMPERRSWGAILGWSMAFICAAGAAFMTWLWWNQGGEATALRTDLAAAYAELEALRSRPAVVSPAPVVQPEVPAVSDPNAVLPDADAPDATAVATPSVDLVPTGAVVTPPSPAAAVPASAASSATEPVAATSPASQPPAKSPQPPAQAQ